MRLLFLRGQVPQDRDPKQIMFQSLDACDDMWTHLAHRLIGNDYGEIWYWNGNRQVIYADNFVERWISNFKDIRYDFKPDVIFARGGFKEYDHILTKYPQAFKIYYGAGKRFYPSDNFKKFDLILNDTHKQVNISKNNFSTTRIELFIKPASENIFKCLPQDKRYDIIYVGNEHPAKGHTFAFNNIPRNMNMIHVGKISKQLKKQFPNIHFTDWLTREKVASLYNQAKVAICCCEKIDSCPRIIAESLACDCPMLVLDSVNLWREKYITKESGKICSKSDFKKSLRWMVNNYKQFNAYKHYATHLSMEIAVQYLRKLIGKN